MDPKNYFKNDDGKAPIADCQPPTQAFLRDLQAVEEVYLRLIELTGQQAQILLSGFSEELLDLARRKESEMEQMARIDKSLRATRSSWEAVQSTLPAQERERVQQMAAQVEETLRQLLQLEDEGGRLIHQERDQKLGQIQRLQSARKFQKAYLTSAMPNTQTLDTRE